MNRNLGLVALSVLGCNLALLLINAVHSGVVAYSGYGQPPPQKLSVEETVGLLFSARPPGQFVMRANPAAKPVVLTVLANPNLALFHANAADCLG